MNNKIKILLISLAALCAISLAVAFQLNAANKALRKQFAFKEQEYQKEQSNLTTQLSKLTTTKKKLDVELGDLRVKFDAMTGERDDFEGKLSLVTKERGILVEKVQELAGEKRSLEEQIAELEAAASQEGGEKIASMSEVTTFDDAYWANILKQKAALELEANNLKKQASDFELKASRAIDEGRKLELQLKTVTEAKSDLQRRLLYSEKLAQTLSEDLVREKRDKKAIGDQFENIRNENFELKSKLMALGDKKSSLETRLSDLQQEREILAKRLAELDQILQERVDQIIAVKDDLKVARTQAQEISLSESKVVQLKPIVVKAQENGSLAKPAGLSGQVLAINEENNFVIIDIGEDDGIKVGQVFNIYREGKRVATVEVIQKRKEISAADIKNLASGVKIKVGDMVN